MNQENIMPFNAADMDWDELASIGILRDELEMAGELDTPLQGGKTGGISLSLILLGPDVVLDATLQLVRRDNGASPLEITGIRPA